MDWNLVERVAVVCAGLWANAAAAIERDDDWSRANHLHNLANIGFAALRSGDAPQMASALKHMEPQPMVQSNVSSWDASDERTHRLSDRERDAVRFRGSEGA